MDLAGLWNTGGAYYNYLNYTYNVALPGTTPSQTWFSLYFGINHQYVLYTLVWSLLLTFWATVYIASWSAKIYNDSILDFTWPNENKGAVIVVPTRGLLGL